MGDIYITAHLRRCLRHSVFGHVLQYTPSTSVLDALHLHHAIKSPPLRYLSPLHITFIEVKNELVKMKDVFPMKVITHTITHQVKSAGGQIESIMHPANFASGHIESKMYPAKFAGGYSHSIMYLAKFAGQYIESKMYPANFPAPGRGLDLLLPSFLPSREEKKIQDQKNCPLGCRGVLHTPYTDCVRTETKMQERRKQSIDSGAEWHTPFMRQGERDAVWRDTFLEQRAHVTIWRDRHLEEKYSHARFQMRISGENSNPYKSSLVALSEQLRDIFTA